MKKVWEGRYNVFPPSCTLGYVFKDTELPREAHALADEPDETSTHWCHSC